MIVGNKELRDRESCKLEERNEKGKNRESGSERVSEWKREQGSSYSNINTSPPRDPDGSAHYITHSEPAHTDVS